MKTDPELFCRVGFRPPGPPGVTCPGVRATSLKSPPPILIFSPPLPLPLPFHSFRRLPFPLSFPGFPRPRFHLASLPVPPNKKRVGHLNSTSTPFLHAQPRQKHELRQISATRSGGYAPRTPEWLHDLLGCALPEARASQERGTIADDDDDDGDTITGTSTSSISKHTQQQQHRTSLRTKASASARSNKNTSGGGGGRHRYVEQ